MTLSWASSPPDQIRRHHAREAAALAGPPPPGMTEAALPPDGAFRGGLLFTPQHRVAEAIVVYWHGGGFVAGSPETHRGVTAWLAQVSGLAVLSGRYRLAPEHPFPAQQEDALAAIEATAALAGPAGLVLAGDSAGACVALWGARAAPPKHRIHGLALFYGGYGVVESESIGRYGTAENGLDAMTLAVMYRRLAPDTGAEPPWPLAFASEIVPPAYVLAASLDAVLDDSLRLARSLPANRHSRLVIVEGQDHGFLKAAGRDDSALQALAEAGAWIAERCRA